MQGMIYRTGIPEGEESSGEGWRPSSGLTMEGNPEVHRIKKKRNYYGKCIIASRDRRIEPLGARKGTDSNGQVSSVKMSDAHIRVNGQQFPDQEYTTTITTTTADSITTSTYSDYSRVYAMSFVIIEK